MRKLIYIILLLPFFADAQNNLINGIKFGAPAIRNAPGDAYSLGYAVLHNGANTGCETMLSLDSLKSTGKYKDLRRDGMERFVRSVNQTYRYKLSTDTWVLVSYGDVTKSYVDSISNTRLKNTSDTYNGFLSFQTNGLDKKGFYWQASTDWAEQYMRSSSDDSTQFVIEVGDNAPNNNGGRNQGLVIRNNTSGMTPYLSNDGWDMFTVSPQELSYNPLGITKYGIWHSGNLPKGTAGQSIRVNTAGTAFEAYTPSAGNSGTVTNISSANTDISVINPTTTPLISLNNVNGITKSYYDPTSSIQGQLNAKAPNTGSGSYIQNGTGQQTADYNITGNGTANSFSGNYLELNNQTSLTAAAAGTMRIGVINNRFGWMGSASGFQFRREIYTNLAANTSFKLPYLASGTLVDSLTNANNLALYVPVAGTTNITGNKTFTGTATFTNNFVISGLNPSLTWQTQDGLNANINRNTTLNEIKFNNSVNQPGATGKSVRLNIDNITGQYISTNRNNTNFGSANATNNLPFTLEFWFKTSYKSAEQGLFINGNTGAAEMSIRLTTSGQITIRGNTQEITAADFVGLNDGNWHYLQYRFVSQNISQIFIDGLQNSGNIAIQYSPVSTSGTLYFGNRGIGVSPFFGEFDNLLYYQRSLSPSELAVNYNLGQGTSNPVSTGLFINVPFDEGAGSVAANIGSSGTTNNFTLVNGIVWNQSGKVANTGSTQQTNWLGSMDGLSGGDRGVAYLGDIQGQARLRAKFITANVNNSFPFVIGTDKNIRIGDFSNSDRDINGSVNPYSRLLLGAGTSGIGQVQYQTSPSVTASANTLGGHWWDGSRMNVVNSATTTAQYAYLSDVGAARTPVVVGSNITMALNADYLNTTATQYTLTLPTTTGFGTDGSRIITVLATGTGGIKILLPSGYSMQAGTAFATTTGTGGATLTQGQKIQLIPIGTNAYYLQALNGSITVY